MCSHGQGHHIPEITTNVKESKSTKQDVSLALPNQEHECYHHIHHHGYLPYVALHRHEVPAKKLKENANSCFTPRLMRTAAMKCGFTDDTENERAGGELTPKKAKVT